MTDALDVITGAFQLLGLYDPGEPLTAADSSLGLTVANDMLDSWSNESLACYAILEQSFPLVPGQQSYTIGPGGQVNATRPLRIIGSPGSCYVQDGNGNNSGLNLVTRAQWNMIGNRDPSVVTSNFPDTLFYDPQYPLGVLNFNPTPSSSYTAFIDSYLQLVDLAVLTSTVSLPPGYVKALKSNLALELKAYYLDGKVDDVLIALAQTSKAAIKRTNTRPNVATYDGAIIARTGVNYNIQTDRTGSTTGPS